jgi:hypothetical protein
VDTAAAIAVLYALLWLARSTRYRRALLAGCAAETVATRSAHLRFMLGICIWCETLDKKGIFHVSCKNEQPVL